MGSQLAWGDASHCRWDAEEQLLGGTACYLAATKRTERRREAAASVRVIVLQGVQGAPAPEDEADGDVPNEVMGGMGSEEWRGEGVEGWGGSGVGLDWHRDVWL